MDACRLVKIKPVGQRDRSFDGGDKPMTNSEVVKRFAEDTSPARTSERWGTQHLFTEGDTLYSYGRHFPLSVRRRDGWSRGKVWYLLNGDRYSVATARHQYLTFCAFKKWPRVSFRTLQAAGINHATCRLVDFWPDGSRNAYFDEAGQQIPSPWDNIDSDSHLTPFEPPVGSTVYTRSSERDGKPHVEKTWHRIGAVLLRSQDQDFLCAMDEGPYFVSRLYRRAKSVADAFKSMEPLEITAARAMLPVGLPGEHMPGEIFRQGEWFFHPIGERKELGIPVKAFSRGGYTLPVKRPGGNLHVATWGTFLRHPAMFQGAGWAVMGCVRHRNRWGRASREHRTLKLDKGVVYQAVLNKSVEDFSSGGRVD